MQTPFDGISPVMQTGERRTQEHVGGQTQDGRGQEIWQAHKGCVIGHGIMAGNMAC
jgi:hypothetical protein